MPSRVLALSIVCVAALFVGGYFFLLRAESVTITVTDVYNTDSNGQHPLPEQEQRPNTLTTRWVVDKGGLTYQAKDGKFEIGKRYRCSVHHPGTGLELRGCESA